MVLVWLEKNIIPKLSRSCDEKKLIEKINRGLSISFCLTKSFDLFVSEKFHTSIRIDDGIDYIDEMAYGRCYPFKEVMIESKDFRCKEAETRILKIALSKKLSEFLEKYKR